MRAHIVSVHALALLVLVSLTAVAAAQTPLGTEFTYQGRLTDSGSPANGLHDMLFRLYDAPINGAQVGSTVCADNVSVTNGLFTVPLDFGAVFVGQELYLQIFLRLDTGLGCASSLGLVGLSPRQAMTAAPYALHARDNVWAQNGINIFNTNSGFVGINRSIPLTSAEYFGVRTSAGAGAYGGMYISVDSDSARPFYGYAAGPRFAWTSLDGANGMWFLQLNNAERLVVEADGNVGIGTTSPGNKLEVVAATNGDGIRLTGATSPLASPGFHLYDGATQRGTLGLAEGSTAFSTDAVAGDVVLRANTGKLLLQNATGASAVVVSGNNVGIGTASPAAKLDVNGDIRIAPVTRFYSISPQDFIPGDSDFAYSQLAPNGSAFLVGRTAGQALSFNAPVHLPDGAVVTRFQVTVLDTSGANVTVELDELEQVSGTGALMASVTSSGSSGQAVLTDTTIASATIGNDLRAYRVQAHWTESATGEIGVGCVRIDYTVTSPLP